MTGLRTAVMLGLTGRYDVQARQARSGLELWAGSYGLYVRVPDIADVLHAIVAVLETRLAASPAVGWTGDLRAELFDGCSSCASNVDGSSRSRRRLVAPAERTRSRPPNDTAVDANNAPERHGGARQEVRSHPPAPASTRSTGENAQNLRVRSAV